MGKETVTSGDIEIEEDKFYHYKSLIFWEDVDTNNVLASNKIFSGENNFRYFINYLYDDYKIKQLHIKPSKSSAYVKRYDGQTKWIHFWLKMMTEDKKYNNTWDKVSADMEKEFYSEPVYDKKFLKTKIKSKLNKNQ